jgi:hypothetical protein
LEIVGQEVSELGEGEGEIGVATRINAEIGFSVREYTTENAQSGFDSYTEVPNGEGASSGAPHEKTAMQLAVF